MSKKIIIVISAIACLYCLSACYNPSDIPLTSESQITTSSTEETLNTTELKTAPITTLTTTQQHESNNTMSAIHTTVTVAAISSIAPVDLKQVSEIIVYQTENQSIFTQYKEVRITGMDKINNYLDAVNIKAWGDPNGYELATLGIYTIVINSNAENRVIVYQGRDTEYGYIRSAIIPKEFTLPDAGTNKDLQRILIESKLDFEEYIMPRNNFEDSFKILFGRFFE